MGKRSRNELLAYCAGLLDADGSFSIHVKPGDPCPNFRAMVQIKQVQREAIDLLQEIFGGRPPKIVRPTATNGRPLFYWYAANDLAAVVATEVLPFLRLKRRQAELVIELREHMKKVRPVSGPKRMCLSRWGKPVMAAMRSVPEWAAAYRRELAEEIRSLNDTRHPLKWDALSGRKKAQLERVRAGKNGGLK